MAFRIDPERRRVSACCAACAWLRVRRADGGPSFPRTCPVCGETCALYADGGGEADPGRLAAALEGGDALAAGHRESLVFLSLLHVPSANGDSPARRALAELLDKRRAAPPRAPRAARREAERPKGDADAAIVFGTAPEVRALLHGWVGDLGLDPEQVALDDLFEAVFERRGGAWALKASPRSPGTTGATSAPRWSSGKKT